MSFNDLEMEDLFPDDWLLDSRFDYDAALSPMMKLFDSQWPDFGCTPAETPTNSMKSDFQVPPVAVDAQVPAPGTYAGFTQPVAAATHDAGFTVPVVPPPYDTGFSQKLVEVPYDASFTVAVPAVPYHAGFTESTPVAYDTGFTKTKPSPVDVGVTLPSPALSCAEFTQLGEATFPYNAGFTQMPVPVSAYADFNQERKPVPHHLGFGHVPVPHSHYAGLTQVPLSAAHDTQFTEEPKPAPNSAGPTQAPVPVPHGDGFIVIPFRIPVICISKQNRVSVINHGQDFKTRPTESVQSTEPEIVLDDAMKNQNHSSAAVVVPHRYKLVPDELKDEKYWKKRRANTAATQRSRVKRKMKMDTCLETVNRLESERNTLQNAIAKVRAENDWMKLRLNVLNIQNLSIPEI